MTTSADKTPQRHGEFYFDPLFKEWRGQTLRNRDFLAKASFWGLTPGSVRAELKLPADRPLVLSGHQPVFFHPGLWAKCVAAGLLADEVQGTACHKLTDTALAPEHPHFLPEIEDNGKARRKQIDFFQSVDLVTQEKTVPYAYLPAPESSALKKIFAGANVFCPSSVKRNIKGYEENLLKAAKAAGDWNEFHASTLRLLDEISGMNRHYLTASKIWSSEPFHQFLSYWLTHLPELSENYNLSLDEYREKNGITHALNPSPNLKFEDWWFEIPFWGVDKYRHRHSLWAKREGKYFMLRAKGTESLYAVPIDDFRNELNLLPMEIWPKALPQTLFCRLYLCDYFIHGTGGSVYEEVNNLFYARTFKTEPLSFGAVTATYFVEPDQTRGIENILGHEPKIQWWERALAKNPEYLFSKAQAWRADLPSFMHPAFEGCLNNPVMKKLAGDKQTLLGEMSDPNLRTGAAARMREVNTALYDLYTEVIRTLEQGLLDAEKVREIRDVLKYREYPFFCYPPDVFSGMAERIHRLNHEGTKVTK